MEFLPVSLYEVLHCDRMTLTKQEIAFIATDILRALQFLHTRGESFGSTLTSRKVMLGGTSAAKLRRFGGEFVERSAGAQMGTSSRVSETHSFWKTPYESAEMCRGNGCKAPATTHSSSEVAEGSELCGRHDLKLAADLYAFGVLLLEMVTSEKPTSETINRISCAEQMDPVFERIVRLALACGGHTESAGPKRNEPLVDHAEETSAGSLLKLLASMDQSSDGPDAWRSSRSFPCFLHADRFAAAHEQQEIERALTARESRFEVATKRLGAVEQELLDEQSNFEVLVRQFEKAELEKQHLMKAVAGLDAQVRDLRLASDHARDDAQQQTAIVTRQRLDAERLRMATEEYHACVLKLQDAKFADMHEKQGLLMEILKLTNEKRRLIDEKAESEKQVRDLAAQVGGEKDAMEDIEGRWLQATFNWEQEQQVRKRLARRLEHLSAQLLAMEDERALYSFELNQTPTGTLDPKQATALVLELKEKEIRALHERVETRAQTEIGLQRTIADLERANEESREAHGRLRNLTHDLEAQNAHLARQLELKRVEIADMAGHLQLSASRVQELTEKVANFEEELDRQAKKRADDGACESGRGPVSTVGGNAFSMGGRVVTCCNRNRSTAPPVPYASVRRAEVSRRGVRLLQGMRGEGSEATGGLVTWTNKVARSNVVPSSAAQSRQLLVVVSACTLRQQREERAGRRHCACS